MGQTKNQLLREVTVDYLAAIDIKNPPTPSMIEEELLDKINTAIDFRNISAAKNNQWARLQRLEPVQIAMTMVHLHHIISISFLNEDIDDNNLLAVYQKDGPLEGIYTTRESDIASIAWQYDYTMKKRDLDEILNILARIAPKHKRCDDPDLIAVKNGIFNYATKELLPFSPDMIFISKSDVAYNPNATNITIHNDDDDTDWDVESWLQELSDDPEIVTLLWEILGAIIRPNVAWNKSAWLYSEVGNNGKGTLCALMRNLCGKRACASIPLAKFSQDFMLEPLLRSSAIIVDENDVGTYIDKAAEVKAIITNDVIMINRKHQKAVSFQFRGFMVQCLNEFPKIKDRSDSAYRRQLFIPMEKSFTGRERKYIKNDYLNRQDVLEYVLLRILHSNFYELSSPARCVEILGEYKEYNDPMRQFINDIEPQLVWGAVPFLFLYALYKRWLPVNIPGSLPLGRNKFIREAIMLMHQTGRWLAKDRNVKIRVGNRMDEPEHLIKEYEVKEYYSPTYNGNDWRKLCVPLIPLTTTGFLRVSAITDEDDSPAIEEDNNDEE